MRLAQICALVGIMVLSSASADAREARFTVENRLGGDSNIFPRSNDTIDDGYFEIALQAQLREARDELNYDFSYTPIYETFMKTSAVDGWDHGASGNLEWRVTPRDSLGMTARFSDARQLRQNFETVVGFSEPIVDETDRERIRRAATGVYYSHQFSPIIGGRLDFNFEDIDFNSDRNIDTRAYGGTVSGSYAYSERTQFGLSASGRYRENLGVGIQSSSQAIIGNVAAQITHEMQENLSFSFQIGPSIVTVDEDDQPGLVAQRFDFASDASGILFTRAISTPGPPTSCTIERVSGFQQCPIVSFLGPVPANSLVVLPPPANGQGESNTETSFFAQARISKRWQRATATFTYARSESASAGVGSSSIVDSVIARLVYRPALYWYFSLHGEWTRQRVVADVRRAVELATPAAGLTLTQDPRAQVPGSFAFAERTSLTSVLAQRANESDVTQWRVIFITKRQLTRQITLLGQVTYSRSYREVASDSSKLEIVRGFVGLRYEFDPLIF